MLARHQEEKIVHPMKQKMYSKRWSRFHYPRNSILQEDR
jgi:hypothetical protein